MPGENATVAIYENPAHAQTAVVRCQESGLDLRKLSVAGRECHTDWSTLPDWAYFDLPGLGPVLVAGPLAGWIVAAVKNEAIFGGLSAFGAALYNINITRHGISACEAALRADKLLVVACGACDEIARIKGILASGGAMLAA